MKRFEDFKKLDELEKERENKIIKTSIFGIIGNAVLAIFKVFIGMKSNSIAILVDAVNNLSDAGSSVITIVGTKLAGKEADNKHPFGELHPKIRNTDGGVFSCQNIQKNLKLS
ncbi:cation transporter [Anaerococcus sp. Marseille-Q7828]|uniref:cation diffusion facilitator family transporter n=1 Tax=Anaerococcus sp. Marseille-Q7828 TaxID=3036300 RepID=UPI0024ADA1AB|nr:cation transporter [Anaerococcus sp. Marseille-Q7828]